MLCETLNLIVYLYRLVLPQEGFLFRDVNGGLLRTNMRVLFSWSLGESDVPHSLVRVPTRSTARTYDNRNNKLQQLTFCLPQYRHSLLRKGRWNCGSGHQATHDC